MDKFIAAFLLILIFLVAGWLLSCQTVPKSPSRTLKARLAEIEARLGQIEADCELSCSSGPKK